MSGATLEQIANLLATLPRSEFSQHDVSLGVCDAAVDLLAALPGAVTRKTAYRNADGETFLIEVVGVDLGGAHFRAQHRERPLSVAEAELLEREGHDDVGYRAVSL